MLTQTRHAPVNGESRSLPRPRRRRRSESRRHRVSFYLRTAMEVLPRRIETLATVSVADQGADGDAGGGRAGRQEACGSCNAGRRIRTRLRTNPRLERRQRRRSWHRTGRNRYSHRASEDWNGGRAAKDWNSNSSFGVGLLRASHPDFQLHTGSKFQGRSSLTWIAGGRRRRGKLDEVAGSHPDCRAVQISPCFAWPRRGVPRKVSLCSVRIVAQGSRMKDVLLCVARGADDLVHLSRAPVADHFVALQR